jgi:hypothetical protein
METDDKTVSAGAKSMPVESTFHSVDVSSPLPPLRLCSYYLGKNLSSVYPSPDSSRELSGPLAILLSGSQTLLKGPLEDVLYRAGSETQHVGSSLEPLSLKIQRRRAQISIEIFQNCIRKKILELVFF